LGAEPSPQTRELYEQIRSDTLRKRINRPTLPPAPIHNLPISLTPFIAENRSWPTWGRLIADPLCRCISLVGPGGIGKTRLALQAADQHASEFVNGTAFIPLAPVGSAESVIPAIANAIQFAFFGPNDPKFQLIHYLREKQCCW